MVEWVVDGREELDSIQPAPLCDGVEVESCASRVERQTGGKSSFMARPNHRAQKKMRMLDSNRSI